MEGTRSRALRRAHTCAPALETISLFAEVPSIATTTNTTTIDTSLTSPSTNGGGESGGGGDGGSGGNNSAKPRVVEVSMRYT
jgi:hypothetical protein